MADDKRERGSPDNKRLNKSEPYEMAYVRSKKRASGASKSTSTRSAKGSGAAKSSGNGATARRAATASQAHREVGRTGDEVRLQCAALAARPGTGAQEPAQGREDGREHGAADDEGGRCGRPAHRRKLRVSALFKQYEKAAKKEAPGEQRQSLAQAERRDAEGAHDDRGGEFFHPAANRRRRGTPTGRGRYRACLGLKDLIAQIESASARADTTTRR